MNWADKKKKKKGNRQTVIKLFAQGYIAGQRQKCELETIPQAFQHSSWTPDYLEFLSQT